MRIIIIIARKIDNKSSIKITIKHLQAHNLNHAISTI